MQSSSRARFFIAFLAMIGTAFFLFFAWKIYLWKSGKEPDLIAEALKREEQKNYAIAMADTYGGKTPQETLQMYIAAVEKGDYELASKYFIIPNQAKELESLQSSKRENIENIIRLLKQTSQSEGSYSEDKKGYGIIEPLYVRFKIYPNGIWKIIEI